MKTPQVVLSMKIRTRLRDRRVLDRLAALPVEVAREVLAEALGAGGEVLADGVREKMPVDSGTARDAVRSRVVIGPDGRGSATVDFDVSAIKANAPNGEFYVAIIEHGTEDRPPVAPLRRTLNDDAAAAGRASADAASRALARLSS